MPSLKDQLKQLLADAQSAETMDELLAIKSNVELVESKIAMAEKQAAVLLPANPATVSVPEGGRAAKTLGEHFVSFRKAHPSADNRVIAPPFAAKAAGDPTPSTNLVPTQYDTDVVRRVAAPLSVLDLFPRRTISAPIYSWNVYSSTTGSVGTTSEGSTKNKLTYNYVPKSATLQKVTGIIKVTDELFEDAPYIVDAINQDLVDDLNANRQAQAVATLLATSGLSTKTVTYSTVLDVLKGILGVAADIEDATHIAPDAVVVTPAIWQMLVAATDADNRFYSGEPFGASSYVRLFGMMFVKNADVTANHLIVGAFGRGAELASKADGVRVESTTSNDVDFEKNLISIRAEAREILAVKRPGCFCNVTLTASS